MAEGDKGKIEKLLPVTEETPQFKNIFIRNVNCKGALQAILLQGLPEMNLENIVLENITMEADYGLVCTDAKNIKIKNLTLKTKKTPVIDLKNTTDFSINGLISPEGVLPVIRIAGSATGNTLFTNSGINDSVNQLIIGKEVDKRLVQVVK